ncbi:hypothetical protein TNCV_1440061 [Trichonephila clavipes]|nr:hypothetical protein TNCV_1440061 [Trichonephila clavipes]
MQCKSPGSSRSKKERMPELKIQGNVNDINEIVIIEKVPSIQTINLLYYVEVPKRIREKFGKKNRSQWRGMMDG